MANIKELLAGREKLAKYDELTEWKKRFEEISEKATITVKQDGFSWDGSALNFGSEVVPLPDRIKQLIVSALDAEIKKLDEE